MKNGSEPRLLSEINECSLNNTEFDVYLMALLGVVGNIFVKLDCDPAPMPLAIILGPMMQE